MNKRKMFITIGIVAAVCLMIALPAKAINSRAGTSAYTFLKIGTGAKSQAMGGAFVGLADDATALYYNPAGLTAAVESGQIFDELLNKPVEAKPSNDFTASYVNYLLDFQFGFLGYVRRIDSTSSAGVSVAYHNYGSFNKLDIDGNNIGTFGASDIAFGVTYSKRISPRVSAGITGKIIYERISSYSSDGLAADVGVMYLVNEEGTTRVGLAVTNFGAQLRGLTSSHKDRLPTKVAAGLSHRLVGLPFLFSGEVGKPFDNDFYMSLGVELVSFKPFFLRLGWTTSGKDYRLGAGNDWLGGFAGGFGYEYRNYKIDYSYSSYADLGAVHRVTLGAGF